MKAVYYYLKRCSDLSKSSLGGVSPNPLVGALIVYNQRIIGEGFHKIYGGPHAEVNAFNSVSLEDRTLIPFATLFVSLEPCNFFGKTPPCTELIINYGVKNITISDIDFTPEVNGNGLNYLNVNGIQTDIVNVEKPEFSPIRFRNVYAKLKRPYIVVKYASSIDGYIGSGVNSVKLSNQLSDRFVHLMRSHVDAILIGKNTALSDSPKLTTRLVPGKSPMKILIDPHLSVPLSNDFFKTPGRIIVYNYFSDSISGNIQLIKIKNDSNFLHNLLFDLHQKNIGILLVEGGSKTIQEFVENELYDEIYEIQTKKILRNGIKKPSKIGEMQIIHRFRGDVILKKFINRL